MFRSTMTLDSYQRVMTVIATLLVPLSALALLAVGTYAAAAMLLFLAVSLGLAWAMSPRAIAVGDGELRVERRAWAPLRVPLGSIVSASAIDELGPGTIRLFGVGGFFGSYGLFRSSSLGRFRLYATRSARAVLVKRSGGTLPLVITPDDVAGVVTSLGARAPSATA
jgi:hypothetical protein